MNDTKEPRIKGIRRKLKLTRLQFSRRYRIPMETIVDWEARRSKPDSGQDAYLTVISREPAFVLEMLNNQRKEEKV